MAFDIEGAKAAGYSEAEIAEHLAKRKGFDIESARSGGYKDTEIASFLARSDASERMKRERDVPEWGRQNPTLYGLYGVGRSLYESVGGPLLEMGGMTAGGLLGSGAGPAGTVGGAALGYAGAKNIDRQIMGALDGMVGKGTEPLGIKDELLQALGDIKTGATYEMGGQAAGAAISSAAGGIGRRLMGGHGRAITDAAAKRGVSLSPADATGRKSLALMESMFDNVITSTGVVSKFVKDRQLAPMLEQYHKMRGTGSGIEKRNAIGARIWQEVTDYLTEQGVKQGDELNAMRSAMLRQMGGDDALVNIGGSVKEAVSRASQEAEKRVGALYDEAGESIPAGSTFQMGKTRDTAREILAEVGDSPGYSQETSKWLKWAADEKPIPAELEAQIAQAPPEIQKQVREAYQGATERGWDAMKNARARLNELIRSGDAGLASGTKGQSNPDVGVYKRLKKAIDADMEAAARASGGDTWAKYQAANKEYGRYKDVFKSDAVKRLVKSNPEDAVDALLRPGGVTEIRTLRSAISGEDYARFQGGIINKLLGVGKNDVFNPQALRTAMSRYGDEVLEEALGKGTVADLKAMAEKGFDITRKTSGTKFLEGIARRDPETVVDAIIGAPESKQASHTMLTNINKLKAVLSKESYNDLGDQLVDKLFQLNQETGMVRPESFAKMVDRYGDRVLSRFYPKEKVDELKTLADIGHRMTRGERVASNPSRTAPSLITWGMVGMMVNDPVTGTAIALTPTALAKLYYSKAGVKWLTTGFKIPASVPQAAELSAKILAVAGEE